MVTGSVRNDNIATSQGDQLKTLSSANSSSSSENETPTIQQDIIVDAPTREEHPPNSTSTHHRPINHLPVEAFIGNLVPLFEIITTARNDAHAKALESLNNSIQDEVLVFLKLMKKLGYVECFPGNMEPVRQSRIKRLVPS